MPLTNLDTKLLALGQAGRSRLSKAWQDPDVRSIDIETRYGFHRGDIQRLKTLLGPRPVAPKHKHCAPRGLSGGWA